MDHEDHPHRRERLRRAAMDAARRLEVTAIDRQGSPRPGDLLPAAGGASGEPPVEWLVLAHCPEPGLLHAVPADTHPLVGAADIRVPAGAAGGPLSLRCAFAVRVHERAFAAAASGAVEDRYVEEALRRCRALEAGLVADDPLGEAADRDPEYRDWLDEAIAPARAAVTAAGSVLPFRAAAEPRQKWGRAAAVAASVLLLLGTGLAGGIAWQARRVERLAAAREAAGREIQRERRRADDAESARRREAEQSRQRIADLESRLDAGGRRSPLVNLPLALLTPVEALRGPATPLRLSPQAPYVLLILELGDVEPFAAYRLDVARGGTGERVWRGDGLTRSGVSEITLALPRDLLPPGEYRLRLAGVREGKAVPVAEYALAVER
jgi:hypothetical protein